MEKLSSIPAVAICPMKSFAIPILGQAPKDLSPQQKIYKAFRQGNTEFALLLVRATVHLKKASYSTMPEALWIQSVSPAETVVAFSCAGDASGKIQVEVGGGSGEKKLFWTAKDGGILPAGMENASLLEGLKRGTYLLSVTDGNGCSIEQNFSITEPEPLLITQTKVDNFCLWRVLRAIVGNSFRWNGALYLLLDRAKWIFIHSSQPSKLSFWSLPSDYLRCQWLWTTMDLH